MAYRVFIASSRESLVYAEEIQLNLEKAQIPGLEPVCWSTGFRLGSYTLESLLQNLKTSMFGVFVLAADDCVELRNESFLIPRDNVILELGMFIAGVGRNNTYIVTPRETPEFVLRLPTDLAGVTRTVYACNAYETNIDMQVAGACTEIKRDIRRQLRKRIAQVDENKLIQRESDYVRKNVSDRIKEYRKKI